MSAKRFLFVGGGTGGHLTPALGLAEALQERGHQTLFLTSGRAVEEEYLQTAGKCSSLGVDTSSLPRAIALGAACYKARREATNFGPDLVVSLGGLCGIAAVGAKLGKPLVLLEGNRVVGKAVRMMQGFAKTTLTLFPDTAKELRAGTCVGPISRKALAPQEKISARKLLGLPQEAVVLLSAGGSQGAGQLNDFLELHAQDLADAGIALLALCGAGKTNALEAAAQKAGLAAVVLEHCHDMGAAYSAADFALCRGGASTIAELCLHRLPAMVVPYPWHKDRQQEHNALALGGGVKIVNDLNNQAWLQLLALLTVSAQREEMRERLIECAPSDGLPLAVELLEQLACWPK